MIAKFLQQQQHNTQMQHHHQLHHPYQMAAESQQHADVQSMMRDMANGLGAQHPQVCIEFLIIKLQ